MKEAALAAKEIRQVLKAKFPAIKFSVKSDNFSMGDAVRVSYYNGPPSDVIEKEISHFQYGHFDGMIDCYEYSNRRDDIPQTKFLSVNRHITDDTKADTKRRIAANYGIDNVEDEQAWMTTFNHWSDQVVWRELANKTL